MLVLSGIRRVDFSHIPFKIVRWRNIQVLEPMTTPYASSQNAVCFDDLKAAALYFDSVIPVAFRSMRGRGEGNDVLFELPEEIPGEVLINLIFNIAPSNSAEKWKYLKRYMDSWEAFSKAIHPARDKFSNDYEDVKRIYLEDSPIGSGSSVRKEFKKFTKELGKTFSTVLLPTIQESSDSNPYSVLVLSGIPLVDASKASWNQIMELRKDSDSRSKLRNLRLFFHNHYTSQSSAFISDDLGRRIEEYHTARRRLGFEATVGSISALIDSKSLQAATATGIAAAFIGGPIGGISSAVLVELGSVALQFSRKRFAIKEFENSHDLAYLIQLKRELS